MHLPLLLLLLFLYVVGLTTFMKFVNFYENYEYRDDLDHVCRLLARLSANRCCRIQRISSGVTRGVQRGQLPRAQPARGRKTASTKYLVTIEHKSE